MLIQEEVVELKALIRRGWTISAIARHLGRDRKTVRSYARGEREPGGRRRASNDSLERYVEYVRIRLSDDPHLWASALYDELKALGYERSYVTFSRQIRERGLRPHCSACAGAKAKDTIEIEHPPGEEIQWDWVEFTKTPWGKPTYLLNGTLSYSGKTRGVFAESMDQAHLIEAIDGVLRRLGGTTRRWRTDRLAGAVDTKTGRLLASFAPVAQYYGVAVDVCAPNRAQRKGAVEKHNDFAARRWWRTAPISTQQEAQIGYDRFEHSTGDGRERAGATVAKLAESEHLCSLPLQPYPATLELERIVSASALVAFRGNQYGIGPGLAGSTVKVRHQLGTDTITILSQAGLKLAEYRLSTPGAGAIQRSPAHHAALEKAVLAAFTTNLPCRRKENRPPSPQAQAAAQELLSLSTGEVKVDLSRYAELAQAQP